LLFVDPNFGFALRAAEEVKEIRVDRHMGNLKVKTRKGKRQTVFGFALLFVRYPLA
jgi:hypothetical protein